MGATNREKTEPNKLRLTDSHTHLDMPEFSKDLPDVIKRALDTGLVAMVTVGISLSSSLKALEIARGHSEIYSTVGWHPHGAHPLTNKEIDSLKSLAEEPKVVAWGEVGLDFYRNRASRNDQISCFRTQVNVAREVKLPLVIHDREAHDETLKILREEAAEEVGGVFHCFSGDWTFAKKCLDLGFYISIPGTVTFKKSEMQKKVARLCPMDRLLIETDAPYLTPVPYRGKRNEPSYVLHTAEKLAEIRNLSLADLAWETSRNAARLFNLP